MQPVDEVVVLLGMGGACSIDQAVVRAGVVPYLVIRCDSVPKVGTLPPLDLHFTLNICM